MAILKSESPDVVIREVDVSGVVPAVTSSTGAFVGDFPWGPINEPILVGNEGELVDKFGSPAYLNDSVSSTEFFAARQFFKYSNSLQVVRGAADTARNATDGTAALIENQDDFDNTYTGLTGQYFAKWAGSVGNSLAVSVCKGSAKFDSWAYAGSFDAAPGTSTFVGGLADSGTAVEDEVHIAIVDQDGLFSGTKNTVLETFANVSLATDAKDDDGLTNYLVDVLNNRSEYVWGVDHPTAFGAAARADQFATHINGFDSVETLALAGGVNSPRLGTAEYETAFNEFEDENAIQVDMLIAPGVPDDANQATIVNDLVTIAESRKDCVVVTSPNRAAVVNNTDPNAAIITCAAAFTKSSYLVVDNNYLKVYDKYRDKYVFIPAATSTAGLMANTDLEAAPWFSPAGNRRGVYLGTTALAYNPTKSERDTLYKADVNPIVNLPGQGITLFGDKTFLGKPTAFSRINVRRLFIVMERAIKSAAQNILFEFNDEFTRAEFVNIVEPFLRDIEGRRGITDFRIVCDETNNTPQIVDTNQFVASVLVKPARSINYVTLNFVATRTGADFEEVLGAV